MKLLVIRFSSIGDIVLTTPVVRCIKRQLPGVELHYLTKAAFREVLAANPYIDRVHYLEDDLGQTIRTLEQEQYDYVIDLHHNLRTARVKRALEARHFSFPKLNLQKWLLVNLKVNLMPDKSIVDRYFETVRELGVRNDGQGLDYFIPEEDRISNQDIPLGHWAGYVGCVIGGTYSTKQLPAEQWQRLFALTPYPVILLGGPGDRELGEQIAAQDPVKIYNACGKFRLNESAHLVERARVIVSNDTGLMHVAAAFKRPVISLWGNTSPVMGMFPYYGFNNLSDREAPQSFIVEHKKLYCHPCSKIGYKRCPQRHFRCMRELDMEVVARTIDAWWKDGGTVSP
jgi:ADP-heptose:LPS heptosyltransferase